MENKLRPAFPNPGEKWGMGIDKFEWFAAHAPAKIPKWFQHSMKNHPEPPKMPTPRVWFFTHTHADIFRKEWDDENNDWFDTGNTDPFYQTLKTEAIQYLEAYGTYQQDCLSWKAKDKEERFLQWRAYYAAKMCEL